MPSIAAYAGQAVFYAAIAAAIGYFAADPVYRQVPEGMAQIKLSFNHAGQRVEDCRKLTYEELSKLPTAKRRPLDCVRERVPVTVELLIDGKPMYASVLKPTGLSSDGPSKAYEKFLVPAGHHVIEAHLRDTRRDEGFDFESRHEADLAPWQSLAIDFKAEQGGFLFR